MYKQIIRKCIDCSATTMCRIKKLTNEELGMFRVSSCVPEVHPGDIDKNVESIITQVLQAAEQGSRVILFPELSITGYTCADLFNDKLLLQTARKSLKHIAERTVATPAAIIVGAPLEYNNRLYNCAVVIAGGKIVGVIPKIHIPNYNEFYEKRWFSGGIDLDARHNYIIIEDERVPFGANQLFDIRGVKIGIEICEDLWVAEPPSGKLCMAGAEIICNPSASDALIGKRDYLIELLRNQSARCRCGYVYSSAGFGESSTDLAFVGNAIIAEDGTLLSISKAFDMNPIVRTADVDINRLRHDRMHFSSFNDLFRDTDAYAVTNVTMQESVPVPGMTYREIDPTPFVDKVESRMDKRCDEISSIQAWGLATRLKAIGCRKAVVGISGGLDSTLALLVTVRAFDMLGLDRRGIIGITMPGFGTTDRTHNNAWQLMETLGVTPVEIPIGEAVKLHFRDIDQDPDKHDITYENSQARERTQILMDMANKENALVIGTGDLSELALGWCTYNGDQMSMYGVNASIPKTMVKYLVKGYARQSDDSHFRDVLLDIVNTPISPELLPASSDGQILQKTEDTVGPYELHDFYLYHMMRYGTDPVKIAAMAIKAFDGKYTPDIIYKWLKTFYKRFFTQQFKRSCMPDGVKTGSICLSPRGDWRMPSDASVKLWLKRIETLEQEI